MRPAFYALAPGGWRDYVTVLHLPYTSWHLSYVVVGGCLAPTVGWGRLGLTVLAFFLGMGIGAHALDELSGRPLQTEIPSAVLVGAAVASLAAACAIGIAVALTFEPWLLGLVAVGAFLAPAYNLELFGGRFHTDAWFALAWGALPVLTGAAASSGTIGLAAAAAAAAAVALSLAQRRLSTPVRQARREITAVTGTLSLRDGSSAPVTTETLVAAPEGALRLLAWSTVLTAAALVAFRL
jgi:hypothetical protein